MQWAQHVLSCFMASKQRYPERLAIVDRGGSRTTTFGQLVDAVNAFGAAFEQKGLKAGDRVALLLGRTMEFHACRLACFAKGIVYVAISQRTPQERRQAMIRRFDPKLVVDTEFAQSALATYPAAPNCLDTTIPDTAPGYMVFTSGTTGSPRCVVHDRSAFEIFAYCQSRLFLPDISSTFSDPVVAAQSLDAYNQRLHRRLLSIADPSMVMSFADIVVAMGSTCLVIPPLELLADRAGMLRFLEAWQVDSGVMIPGLLATLSSYQDFKLVIAAGDANKYDFSCFEDASIVNVYGASECFAMGYGDAKRDNTVVALVPGAKLYADQGDGEICYCGPGVMTGRIDDVGELVAADAVLRTGDWGRQKTDHAGQATVEILGRLDNTVKIRGNRVAFEEVEWALASVPGVAEAAVELDARTHDSLIGFYVSENGGPIDTALFLQVASMKLPEYMIPQAFVRVDSFSHTVSGKIARDAVRDMALVHAQTENLPQDFVPPADEVEARVALVFCHVLERDRVSVTDGFTHLGGDSLSALFLQEELAKEFDISISANQLLDLQTARSVAHALKNPTTYGLPQVKELLYSYEDLCPLTDAQWNTYFSHLDSDSTKFSLPFYSDLSKELTDEEIFKAMEVVLARHPGLTGRLVHVDGKPYMRYGAGFRFETGTSEDLESFLQPFDLSEGMVRMLLVEQEDCKRLYTNFHHLAIDGTSISLLAHEFYEMLGQIHGTPQGRGKAAGGRMDHLSLRGDEIDASVLRQLTFEKLIRDTSAFEAAGSFFKKLLEDSDSIEELLPSAEPGRHRRTEYEPFMDVDVARAFASQHGMTVAQLVTLGFSYTLSVFTGGSRVSFSMIEDGRGMAGTERGIGMFTRTIPLVIDCKNQSMTAFLEGQSAVIRRALTFDFYPLHLISAFGKINTQVQFQYAHELREYSAKHQLLKEGDALRELVQSNCDLSFEVIHREGRLACEIEHSELYSDELCRSMVAVFQQVVQGFMEVRTLVELPVLPSSHLAWLDSYNQNIAEVDGASLTELLNRSVSQQGERPFVAFENGSYTYGQGAFLIAQIAQAAAKARAGEDGRGNAVVFTDRSQYFVLAAWGALVAGCAYVPVEAAHPDERVAYVAQTVEADVVLVDDRTEKRALELFQGNDIPIVNVQRIVGAYDGVSTLSQIEAAQWSDEDVAFVVFTSGSTGKPKGVLTPMRSFANMIHNYVKNTSMTCEDVYSLYTPLSFDMHSLALFTTVAVGACVTVVPEKLRLQLTGLDAYFRRMGTTHTCMTTHIGKLFLSSGLGKSLKHLLVIGEMLGEFTAPSQPTMWESYGPAETYALITMVPVNQRSHRSSVGALFANMRTYLVDQLGRRVPKGAVGEICIAGRQVALGYCKRPDLTAASFVANPFVASEPSYDIMYRTGDMGRYLTDGTIGILGRRDTQVKIRGNRVELGEVESAVKLIAAVKDAVVGVAGASGEKELVAYVVLHEDTTEAALSPSELSALVTEEVRASKPSYMVPAYVVRLDEFPLNTSGKIDRRSLPKVDADMLQARYVSPTNALEEAICQVLADITHVERFGIDDDFTFMGGDSVGAMRAAYELEKAGVYCTALQILNLRTPRELAKVSHFIEPAAESVCDPATPGKRLRASVSQDGTFVAPLSSTQMNFYDNETTRNMGNAYVFCSNCVCPAGTTLEQAHAAVQALVEVHPVLSGKIDLVEGTPCVVSGGDCQIVVIQEDLASNPALADQMRQAVTRPFVIGEGIARFAVGAYSGQVGIAAACHHIISDATSERLVTEHLMKLLQGQSLLPEWDFVQLANSLIDAADSRRFANARDYFLSRLTDAVVERHALGLHRTLGGDAGTLVVAVPGVRSRVSDYCDCHGLTVGSFLHGLFAYVLRDFTGYDAAMYKTGLRGRYTPASLEALGCYAEFTIAFNDSCTTIHEAMAGALESMLDAADHSIYPYKLLKNRFPNITYVPFFEYVPLQTSYEKGNVAPVMFGNHAGIMEHVAGDDGSQIADFTGAVYDFGDGFAFTVEHTSKYRVSELEGLAKSFFRAMMQVIEEDSGSNVERH